MSFNGTLNRGTPTYAAGKFGNALTGGVYNLGTPDITMSSTGADGGNLNTGTIEFWMYGFPTSGTIMLAHNGWYQITTNGTGNLYCQFGSGFQVGIVTTGGYLTAGSWHHVAAVFSAGVITIYIDGHNVGTSSTAAPLTAGSVGLNGAISFGGSENTSGPVDEVRFSSIARYSGATYTVPTTAFTDDSSTLALYHLEADATDSHSAAATVPGAPTGLAATAANTSVALSWTAPVSNGGTAITDYTVQYRTTAGPGTWTTFTHTAQTTTTLTVTGLTNGTGYDFQVAAVNSVGTSTYSATASATPTTSTTSFAPNDTNIVYSPYNWNVTGTAAQTASSGAYLRFTVTTGATSTLTANFDTTAATGTQQVAIRIDNAPAVFANVTSAVAINLAGSGSGWNVHTVELAFRWLTGTDLWTAPTGGVKFTGITASAAISTRTMRRRPLNILCYGDSIANGYLAGPGQSDTRYGWAYPLGALLGAEVGIAAYTGQGWLNAGNGNVPAFTTTYNGLWSGQTRGFTSPAEPALVLINMGTNDSTDVTTAATTVLNGILAATTTAKIVLIQQWNGTAHKTQLQAAAAACTAPARVTYLDTTGWLNSADTVDGTHPIGYINLADLSPRIAASVESLIAGTVTPKRYVNVGGTAKPIA